MTDAFCGNCAAEVELIDGVVCQACLAENRIPRWEKRGENNLIKCQKCQKEFAFCDLYMGRDCRNICSQCYDEEEIQAQDQMKLGDSLLEIATQMSKQMERFSADYMSYQYKNINVLPGISVEIIVKETRKKK